MKAMSEDFNHWDAIADELSKATGQVVRKTAFAIQAGYQARAPRDTGFMANSAYVVTSEDNTYGQGGAPTHKDAYLLPCVEAPPDDQTAYAAVGANYAQFPEFGTRFAPSQPAFVPACDVAQAGMDVAMGAIEDKLKAVTGG
jgi:hypothetical protein